jgi:hypothetical protein
MIKVQHLAVVLLCVSPALASAQAPAGPPKPSPEQKRLGYFVGNWHGEGEVKANPFMPAGKMSTEDTCAWFEGGFAVVCNSTGMGPWGPTKSLGIMGYSSEEKVYTYAGVDNGPMAMTTVPHGIVKGGEWVYNDSSMMGGKMVKSRYVINEVSPTSYSFKWEMQGADGAWQTVMAGTQTKK